MNRTFTRLVPLLIACAALFAACGGSNSASSTETAVASLDSPASTTTVAGESGPSTDQRQAFLDFAKCMRDNGVDFPDPTFDADGQVQINPGQGAGRIDPQSDAFKACSEKLAAVQGQIGPNGAGGADRESTLAFAKCLRDNGVDFADPTFDANGNIDFSAGPPAALTDPAAADALQKCQSLVQRP